MRWGLSNEGVYQMGWDLSNEVGLSNKVSLSG